MSSRNVQSSTKQEYLQKLEEENLQALRASVEAVNISRATLETSLAQGEQLQRCEDIHERNKYIVDKSNRIVRGMTWSGWFMNVFSKDVEPPTSSKQTEQSEQIGRNTDDSSLSSIISQSDVARYPVELRNVAMMIQNYKCNVILLQNSQKHEFETCLEICTKLHDSIVTKNNELKRNGYNGVKLDGRNMQHLRTLEKKLQEVYDFQYKTVQARRNNRDGQNRNKLASSNSPRNNSSKPSPRPAFSSSSLISSTTNKDLQDRIERQDNHLNMLASNIEELMHNGSAIGATLESQSQLLEKLDSETDDLHEKTKMVTRRADRLAHRSMWGRPKSDYKYRVAIEHIPTKKYLRVEPHNHKDLTLHETLHPEMSTFECHERREFNLIGFKNVCTSTWLGRSAFGSIVCSAKVFGSNEEWEIDDDMTSTKLLCAAANMGNGGWLICSEGTENFSITRHDIDGRTKATLWRIVVVSDAQEND